MRNFSEELKTAIDHVKGQAVAFTFSHKLSRLAISAKTQRASYLNEIKPKPQFLRNQWALGFLYKRDDFID